MKPLLMIKKQGVYGSLQDQGRFHYRAYGIPLSGPMDKVSFQLAQQILTNVQNQTSFEMFIGGFEFQALHEATYVLTGATCHCLLNGSPVEMWKTFRLVKGDILSIKSVKEGSIVYLTPKGGFQTKPILGSMSSLPMVGNQLSDDNVLYGHNVEPLHYTRGLYASYRPRFHSAITVRIFKGPHFELFTDDSKQHFLNSPYQFTGGNRMGYYLKGNVLDLISRKDILSEATQYGTIQVPQSGEPIVLMADAQTVGGYPIIATIHEDDLHKVAQMRMFNTIRFALMEE
ncbi:biotin-dependent carboxyltransferase family protein [Lysinibacillus sp. NPDC097279]|uniref:5-oxoprolinase subunit C family protein n=1 Tax=Lysinibacillus sp. NPDC097279 TaxID=3364143 RepID=UPI003806A54F